MFLKSPQESALATEIHEHLAPALLGEVLAFLDTCPGRTYLQEPDWPAFAPGTGKRHGYHHAIVRDRHGAIALYGLMRLTRLPAGIRLAAFRRGPVVRRPADLATALPALLPVLRKRGVATVTLNPRWEDADAIAAGEILADLGGVVLPDARQTLHRTTGLVAVDGDLEQKIAGFSKSARKIVRGLDKVATIRPGISPEGAAEFGDWTARFAADRKTDISGLPSIEARIAHAERHGGMAVTVEIDGRAEGYLIGLRDGDRLLPFGGAWRDTNADLPRDYILFWNLILAARERGLRWLDVGGLTDPDSAQSHPHTARRSALARDQFKMRFNPRVVRLTPIHEMTLRPLPGKVIAWSRLARQAARRR